MLLRLMRRSKKQVVSKNLHAADIIGAIGHLHSHTLVFIDAHPSSSQVERETKLEVGKEEAGQIGDDNMVPTRDLKCQHVAARRWNRRVLIRAQ